MQTKIEITNPWAPQNITAGVAKLVCRRDHKAIGIEPSGQSRVRQSAITDPVRPGSGPRVGIIEIQHGSKGKSRLCGVDGVELPGAQQSRAPAVRCEAVAFSQRQAPGSRESIAETNVLIRGAH